MKRSLLSESLSHAFYVTHLASEKSEGKLGGYFVSEFSTEYASGVTIAYRKQFRWILMPLLPHCAARHRQNRDTALRSRDVITCSVLL